MWKSKFFSGCIFFAAIPAISICQQRTIIILSYSPNALQPEIVTPGYLPAAKNIVPVYRIEIIDNRLDENKLGFNPVYKYAPKEIKLNIPLPEAIKKIFADGIQVTDTAHQRKMIVVIQQCWITYFAESKFNFIKKSLLAKLDYNIECFTSIDTNYYPLKRMSGNIVMMYNNQTTPRLLVDSMIHLLQHEVEVLSIAEGVNQKTVISETRMDNYILQKKLAIPRRIRSGMYASFDDFLSQKVITDSIDVIPYKDYYNRNVLAANLAIIKNGAVEPCNKHWGYFDGRYLFYNTGNGFFVRLVYAKGQYVLVDLQQIATNTIKKSITSESVIGNTPYNILKDYAKTTHLLFQLNYEDGKLH